MREVLQRQDRELVYRIYIYSVIASVNQTQFCVCVCVCIFFSTPTRLRSCQSVVPIPICLHGIPTQKTTILYFVCNENGNEISGSYGGEYEDWLLPSGILRRVVS
jgi:hypothetical protein